MVAFPLLVHILSTLAMVGVIWMVQLVHYPLFSFVRIAEFAEFEAAHVARIQWIVVPLMLLELLSGAVLLTSPLPVAPRPEVALGLGLLLVAWGVTALYSVPAHAALSGGWDAEAHARLVATNWLRTLAWSARGALVAVWLARVFARLEWA